MKFVSIMMGSKSDYEIMSECARTLEKFGARCEPIISSAHHSPERTQEYIKGVEEKGAKVFIAAAGMVAHLTGTVAAYTIKPVLGVPIPGNALVSMDSLFSAMQMPGGILVGTLAVNKTRAKNAACLTMQILALNDETLVKALEQDRENQEENLISDSKSVEVLL